MKIPLYILTGLLMASDSPYGESRHPKPKLGKKFHLDYFELPRKHEAQLTGDIICEFTITKTGEVVDPRIVQTFNPEYNDIILQKIKATKYKPALQNGQPVAIKYLLPIKFE